MIILTKREEKQSEDGFIPSSKPNLQFRIYFRLVFQDMAYTSAKLDVFVFVIFFSNHVAHLSTEIYPTLEELDNIMI